MAIIPSLPGLQIQIAVGGEALEEHAPPTTTTFTNSETECYIAAEPETDFCIEYEIYPDFPYQSKSLAIRTVVNINGEHIDSQITNWKYNKIPFEGIVSGKRNFEKGKNTTVQQLRFSKLIIGIFTCNL